MGNGSNFYNKVLLIDESKTFGRTLNVFIKYYGFKLINLANPELLKDKSSYVYEEDYEVIVMEYDYSELDYKKVLDLIRGSDKLRGLPKILITSFDNEGKLDLLDEEFNDIFYKPISINKVLDGLLAAVRFLRIMIVTSKKSKLNEFKSTLEEYGYICDIYYNQEQALKSLENKQYKFIVADFDMKMMSPAIFLAWIRSLKIYKSVPIVGISTRDFEKNMTDKINRFNIECILKVNDISSKLIPIIESKISRSNIAVLNNKTIKESIYNEMAKIGLEEKEMNFEEVPFDIKSELTDIATDSNKIDSLNQTLDDLSKDLEDLLSF